MLLVLTGFLLCATSSPGFKITLAWDESNTEDPAGYKIFCRAEGEKYNYNKPAWAGTETIGTVELKEVNTYCFVVRSFDRWENESINSNEICYIRPQNNLPIVEDLSITTREDIPADLLLTATDNDSDPLTYIIVDQPEYGTLSGIAPSLIYLPFSNYNGLDYFTFKANDGKADSNTATVTIFINPVNDPPEADAGPDQTVEEDTLVFLDASRSIDTEDAVLSYLWTQKDGISVTLSNPNSIQTSFIAPDVGPDLESLHFQLTVTDNGGLQDTDTLKINVFDINEVLIIDKGSEPIEAELITVSGWNLISLPVMPESTVLSELFPDALVVYSYEKKLGYIRITGEQELEVGKGYWILFEGEQSYKFVGQPIEKYDWSVYVSGWNMIGGCTYPAKVSINDGKIETIYQYVSEAGYQRVTNTDYLQPGKGYWILYKDITDQAVIKIKPKKKK